MLSKAYCSSKERLPGRNRIVHYLTVTALSTLFLISLCYGLFHNLLPVHAAPPPVLSTVFLDTTAPTFTITTAGNSGSLSYSETDLSGTIIMRGQLAVTSGQTVLTLPRQGDGYYALQISDHTTTSAAGQTIPFAVVSPFTPTTNSPFGVGVHFTRHDNPNLARFVTTMGAGWSRDDATWAEIEQSPGSYNFSTLDPSMQILQQNTINPLLILDYNNRFYDHGVTPYDSAGLTAFANYARAVVAHYGPQLKAVEVYNEYNGLFSNGPCTRKAACYAQMLRYTYQAIKSIRPDVAVVGGAAFSADLNWFNDLFQNGGLNYMDVVSDHPYTNFNITSPELQGTGKQMMDLQNLIERYNHGKARPIWITELGWPTATSLPLSVNEHTQANYLVRGVVLSLAAGVQKFFWYDFLNDGTDATNQEQNFGLLRRPDAAGRYTPKPAYAAYAVLIRELTNRSFMSSEKVAPSIYDILFSGNLRVLWSTPLSQSVALSTNNPVTVTSMTGRTQIFRPAGGRIVLNLSAEPLYLQGIVSSVTWNHPF